MTIIKNILNHKALMTCFFLCLGLFIGNNALAFNSTITTTQNTTHANIGFVDYTDFYDTMLTKSIDLNTFEPLSTTVYMSLVACVGHYGNYINGRNCANLQNTGIDTINGVMISNYIDNIDWIGDRDYIISQINSQTGFNWGTDYDVELLALVMIDDNSNPMYPMEGRAMVSIENYQIEKSVFQFASNCANGQVSMTYSDDPDQNYTVYCNTDLYKQLDDSGDIGIFSTTPVNSYTCSMALNTCTNDVKVFEETGGIYVYPNELYLIPPTLVETERWNGLIPNDFFNSLPTITDQPSQLLGYQSDLAKIGSSMASSTIGLATTNVMVFWPFILVISLIGYLILQFKKLAILGIKK